MATVGCRTYSSSSKRVVRETIYNSPTIEFELKQVEIDMTLLEDPAYRACSPEEAEKALKVGRALLKYKQLYDTWKTQPNTPGAKAAGHIIPGLFSQFMPLNQRVKDAYNLAAPVTDI